MCPESLRGLMRKILLLRFSDIPPYDEIIEALKQEIIKEVRIGPDLEPINHEFEWQQSIASRIKAKYMREFSAS